MEEQKLDPFLSALLGSVIVFFLGALGMYNNVVAEKYDGVDRTGNKIVMLLFMSTPGIIIVTEIAKSNSKY
mgnify:CR=1 FL=1